MHVFSQSSHILCLLAKGTGEDLFPVFTCQQFVMEWCHNFCHPWPSMSDALFQCTNSLCAVTLPISTFSISFREVLASNSSVSLPHKAPVQSSWVLRQQIHNNWARFHTFEVPGYEAMSWNLKSVKLDSDLLPLNGLKLDSQHCISLHNVTCCAKCMGEGTGSNRWAQIRSLTWCEMMSSTTHSSEQS